MPLLQTPRVKPSLPPALPAPPQPPGVCPVGPSLKPPLPNPSRCTPIRSRLNAPRPPPKPLLSSPPNHPPPGPYPSPPPPRALSIPPPLTSRCAPSGSSSGSTAVTTGSTQLSGSCSTVPQGVGPQHSTSAPPDLLARAVMCVTAKSGLRGRPGGSTRGMGAQGGIM
jgi:hypothetical protein